MGTHIETLKKRHEKELADAILRERLEEFFADNGIPAPTSYCRQTDSVWVGWKPPESFDEFEDPGDLIELADKVARLCKPPLARYIRSDTFLHNANEREMEFIADNERLLATQKYLCDCLEEVGIDSSAALAAVEGKDDD